MSLATVDGAIFSLSYITYRRFYWNFGITSGDIFVRRSKMGMWTCEEKWGEKIIRSSLNSFALRVGWLFDDVQEGLFLFFF
jgi:hypothetical protein